VSRPRSDNRGAALLMALLVTISLAGIAVGFSRESGVDLDLASFTRDGDKAYHLARSGLNTALWMLLKDVDRQVDTLRQPWADPKAIRLPADPEEGTALLQVVSDESGKLNLNRLIDESGAADPLAEAQVKRLLALLGIPEGRLDPVLDWLDADNQERPNGAESLYYQSLDQPYDCANGPLLTMGQIGLIRGCKEILPDVRNYLTIYSDGKVNLNTASVVVLRSLSLRMDRSVAEAIVDYRKDKDFLSVEDLRNIASVTQDIFEEIAPLLTVRSSAFSVSVKASVQAVESAIEAVVIRGDMDLKTIYWRVS